MKIWVELKVLPKKEILDVQGRAIVQTLVENNKPIEDCRCGKYIHICVDANDSKQAFEKTEELAKYVLYNPLIETCEIKVLS